MCTDYYNIIHNSEKRKKNIMNIMIMGNYDDNIDYRVWCVYSSELSQNKVQTIDGKLLSWFYIVIVIYFPNRFLKIICGHVGR